MKYIKIFIKFLYIKTHQQDIDNCFVYIKQINSVRNNTNNYINSVRYSNRYIGARAILDILDL